MRGSPNLTIRVRPTNPVSQFVSVNESESGPGIHFLCHFNHHHTRSSLQPHYTKREGPLRGNEAKMHDRDNKKEAVVAKV